MEFRDLVQATRDKVLNNPKYDEARKGVFPIRLVGEIKREREEEKKGCSR